MDSEVAGSYLIVFPRKRRRKKQGFSDVQKPVKLNHLKTIMMRAMYRIIASHSNPEKVALDNGYSYLIGVPDIIREIRQV